jgi:hypothetical protein
LLATGFRLCSVQREDWLLRARVFCLRRFGLGLSPEVFFSAWSKERTGPHSYFFASLCSVATATAVFSQHAGRFPFGPCLACLELGSRSYRHSALLTGFRCLAVGSHPVVGIVFLGLIQGASFGLTGGCELCAPACASFVFFLVIFYELKLALWR